MAHEHLRTRKPAAVTAVLANKNCRQIRNFPHNNTKKCDLKRDRFLRIWEGDNVLERDFALG